MHRRVLVGAALMLSAAANALASEDLALGKPVAFAPAPNYRLTVKRGTDAADLTDGKLSSRSDDNLWFDAKCVGWSYAGLVQMALDLGAPQPVGEVAIRLQGGSPQAGICLPCWVDVLASLDGKRFYRVASYSRWRLGDKAKFGVPRNEGKSWVHRLAFTGLDVRARYVGISFYGTGLNVSDELYVMRGDDAAAKPPADLGHLTGFTTEGVRVYFHKPALVFTTNINTPTPVGMIVTPEAGGKPFELVVDLPQGLRFVGGRLGGQKDGVDLAAAKGSVQGEFTRYTFKLKAGRISTKTLGRIYVNGDWPAGKKGVLRFQTRWAGGSTPLCSKPIQAIEIPKCPVRSKRLMLGLGWWSLGSTMAWPDALDAFETIGFNTVPLFARWTKLDDPEVEAFLAECRERGFKIVNIDSTFHHMLSRYKRDKSLYCQFADGSVGKRFCPSYRGPHYKEEIQRLARESARAGASYVSCDIELWSWRGPVDAAKCTRCQADFKASGLKDIKQWQLDKGEQIWRDMAKALRAEMTKAGHPMPDFGGYDFRVGRSYQFFWPFDRLYPHDMTSSQPSTYTPLEPYHLELIGDEARTDRAKLSKSDVIPWLTPGDSGTFPGHAFRLALLECFANGSRGVYFWSCRVWDAETLAAFARAIRNVAPVEDVIVDGALLKGAVVMPQARLSGMRKRDRMIVLIADYYRTEKRAFTLHLPVDKPSVVTDLDTGAQLGELTRDANAVRVEIGPERARLLGVEPRQ